MEGGGYLVISQSVLYSPVQCNGDQMEDRGSTYRNQTTERDDQ